jgi:hypothetical protein
MMVVSSFSRLRNSPLTSPFGSRWWLCGLLLGGLTLGCASTSGSFYKQEASIKKAGSGSARIGRILPLWSIATQQDSSGVESQGFLGKVMFFSAGSDRSRTVDNGVRVLISEAVDDTWKLKQEFIITPEALTKKRNSTALGEVYKLFIPHDIQTEGLYGIVVEYTAKDGSKTVSPATKLP